jgi:hypothetical protein
MSELLIDIHISEHPKVANKPHLKRCSNTQQLFDLRKQKIFMDKKRK